MGEILLGLLVGTALGAFLMRAVDGKLVDATEDYMLTMLRVEDAFQAHLEREHKDLRYCAECERHRKLCDDAYDHARAVLNERAGGDRA